MIGLRYIDELFAVWRIPREFWRLISEDFRFDGRLGKFEGFLVLVFLPVVSAALVAHFEVIFNNQFYSLLIAAATLFVGFSMNSILLLLRYSRQDDASTLLIDQTRNLISYLLYIGVVLALIGLVGYAFTAQYGTDSTLTGNARLLNLGVSILSIFALVHFLIVVMLLPARIFTIIERSTTDPNW